MPGEERPPGGPLPGTGAFCPGDLQLAVNCSASVVSSLPQFPHATCQGIFLASYDPASDSIPDLTSQSCSQPEQQPGSQDTWSSWRNLVLTGVGAGDRPVWHPVGGPLSITARPQEAFYCFSNLNQAAGWSWGPSSQPTQLSGRARPCGTWPWSQLCTAS